ncbi:MAG: ABC transporter ATP-binding protein [Candidatus Kapaibacteriota bacterium]
MIEIKNLSKSFGEKQILKNINMTIEQGKTTCIIGKSGSGKSVLIKHLVGLLEPDSGTVKIDGQDIPKLTRKELFEVRKKMGFVFQGAALFDSFNVFENVIIKLFELGTRDFGFLEKEAIRVLSAVQLLPDENEVGQEAFRKEWNILKNKMPSELSGGMRKRLGLARALVGNPEYLFYDEPTTGLDPVTSEQIDELILEVQKKVKVTSIVITHDLFSVYKIADKVAMLHNGNKVFDGDVKEFRNSDIDAIKEFQMRYN